MLQVHLPPLLPLLLGLLLGTGAGVAAAGLGVWQIVQRVHAAALNKVHVEHCQSDMVHLKTAKKSLSSLFKARCFVSISYIFVKDT